MAGFYYKQGSKALPIFGDWPAHNTDLFPMELRNSQATYKVTIQVQIISFLQLRVI